ncbi:tRNA modification GTPase MnmE [Alteripontixanthobacter maritimus]|uniref:tRNA modification GTPase MnmE n=1 Tax=Alteripontixanthobacter maritimus TaxID=2161824 RepID=A0A369QD40_9SPHN|nr:tRNA uridine-5-carboxymethylaminomethyl(34) synthesis GTPase MnmE [Alteripontixanthobacter maritimus]RDC61146.1 tRNA modification GTPase MnmE [Alteripontixanthobacter maritimus]
MSDTIFALSSGMPPAGIAVIRISGLAATDALTAIAGRVPEPRRATAMTLRSASGEVLDQALVLFLPGPNNATGEDSVELHCHGGRALVAAVSAELERQPDLRPALPGEFTRRAFANGRLDLAEAEGLGDLLLAETELQRASAMTMMGGALSQEVAKWREAVLRLSAEVEGVLDFSDEEDSAELSDTFFDRVGKLVAELRAKLARPTVEALRNGYRVALAGPPNAGKSTLFNALVAKEAAITSPVAGTTRDVIERTVSFGGVPMTFVDMAGLHEGTGDAIEAVGIDRARNEIDLADCVLWLGPPADAPQDAVIVRSKVDCVDALVVSAEVEALSVSPVSGEGMETLRHKLDTRARLAMPKPGEAAINARQRTCLEVAATALAEIDHSTDPLLVGESLRAARSAFDAVIGKTSTEDMLDALFSQFCIGK